MMMRAALLLIVSARLILSTELIVQPSSKSLRLKCVGVCMITEKRMERTANNI